MVIFRMFWRFINEVIIKCGGIDIKKNIVFLNLGDDFCLDEIGFEDYRLFCLNNKDLSVFLIFLLCEYFYLLFFFWIMGGGSIGGFFSF